MKTNSSHNYYPDLATHGEELASEALAAAGYQILERNWQAAAGEVDIIAYHQQQLVAIEVKTRSGIGFGNPLETVTSTQLRRIQRGLLHFKRTVYPKYAHTPLRDDVVGILIDSDGEPTSELLQDVNGVEPTQSAPVGWNMNTPTRIGNTLSIALTGMMGQPVSIEADIGNALPGFTLLGLPDQSLQEAKDRIRAAARNSGLPLTKRHLTVNLTPASLHKRGSLFDLAILMAAWGADYVVRDETGPVFLAALGLDGSLQTAPGILPAVMAAADSGYTDIIVAEDAREQAEMVPGTNVRGYGHVTEVAREFGASVELKPHATPAPGRVTSSPTLPDEPDLLEIHGQAEARWALEIAAAGGHHLLLEGPPGAGKTMLAERLPTIMAEMDPATALENAALHSLLAGSDSVTSPKSRPPFEAPHHSTTMTALLGGGSGLIRPGAVSMAHGGVLFLD